jgi:hypothetical protein
MISTTNYKHHDIRQFAAIRRIYFLVFGIIISMILVYFLYSHYDYDAFGETDQSHSIISQHTITSSMRFVVMEISNLRVYENSTFGIKIQYPSDWKINGETSHFFQRDLHKDNLTQVVVFSYFNRSDVLLPSLDLSAYTSGMLSNMTLKEFTYQRINHLSSLHKHLLPGAGKVTFLDSNMTTLAGNPAYKIAYTFSREAGYPISRIESWTIKDSRIYMVTLTDYTGEALLSKKISPAIQRIINSFEIEK